MRKEYDIITRYIPFLIEYFPVWPLPDFPVWPLPEEATETFGIDGWPGFIATETFG